MATLVRRRNMSHRYYKPDFKDDEEVVVEYNENGNVTEKVLSVSPDGVKVSHIQDAIDAAVAEETERAEEAEQALDEKIEAETVRATEAEESISGDVSTLSASTIAFSAETVSEIIRLDTKIDTEIERAQSVETALQADIDEVVENVAELSAATEAFSAQTVSELDRLDRQDIKSDDYTFRVNGTEEEGNGLIINRKGGEGPIIIAFDGNFGSGMPLAL